MFILRVRVDDRIIMGECRATVVKIDRDGVRLGIASPADVAGSTVDSGLGKGRAAPGFGRETGKSPPAGVWYVNLRTGETVVIASCRITVVRTHGSRVRLGVEAPDDVLVSGERISEGFESATGVGIE